MATVWQDCFCLKIISWQFQIWKFNSEIKLYGWLEKLIFLCLTSSRAFFFFFSPRCNFKKFSLLELSQTRPHFPIYKSISEPKFSIFHIAPLMIKFKSLNDSWPPPKIYIYFLINTEYFSSESECNSLWSYTPNGSSPKPLQSEYWWNQR